MHEILKPFTTRVRRFAPGDAPVSATAELSPHSLEGLQAGGFLSASAVAGPAPTPKGRTKSGAKKPA